MSIVTIVNILVVALVLTAIVQDHYNTYKLEARNYRAIRKINRAIPKSGYQIVTTKPDLSYPILSTLGAPIVAYILGGALAALGI
jgi:UDP-N-acetylmuramate-alanine ligase